MTLAVFWGMALCVFLQFFTRYVLNNSLAWTEEIAAQLPGRRGLPRLGLVRPPLAPHPGRRALPLPARPGVARLLSTLVDLIRIVFFAYASLLLWRYVGIVAHERMVTIDLPRSLVFYSVFAAFVLMLLRSIQVAWANWRRGYSVLERPGAFDGFGD